MPMQGSSPEPEEDWKVPREVAVPRLLDRHGAGLYQLSRRICGNDDEAEDLVQEVFLQAWRSWDGFRGDSSPSVWLFTIARHACQRMHRRRSGEPEHMESIEELLPIGETELVMPPEHDPLADQISREHQELVGRAIAALPVEFRMALVLKEIVGFSIADTAQILGLNPQTVKTRVHRARLKVKRAMEVGLEKARVPDHAYSLQLCLDLLNAKQDALDRGVEMPNADGIICDRCRFMFSTLDYCTGVARSLGDAEPLPDRLRSGLLEAMESDRSK